MAKIVTVGENEYHFQDLRKILGLEHIYSQLGQISKSVQTMHGRFGFTLTLLCYSGRWVGWCDILADM